ncbi:hypothetical protein DSO57_1018849 [Entomophthora muscae]|uniref:Uncharacterized protein n=1 Tax=Entomophthora muscae TaxID=34485 RepID=A0ACC2UDW8_9FUNG|nr:hypothetical protein DSO57_1018849 [Entomophthora muscae]
MQLGIFSFVCGSMLASTVDYTREFQTHVYLGKLRSKLLPPMINHPVNLKSKGWLAPEIQPTVEQSLVWYHKAPLKLPAIPVEELQCVEHEGNPKIQKCKQKYLEGYYWGESIQINNPVVCPDSKCRLTISDTFYLPSFELSRNKSNQSISTVLNNAKWKINASFTYPGKSNMILWFKPLYWAKATWFSQSKYLEAKAETVVSTHTVVAPINHYPSGALGMSNGSLDHSLQFISPIKFDLQKMTQY